MSSAALLSPDEGFDTATRPGTEAAKPQPRAPRHTVTGAPRPDLPARSFALIAALAVHALALLWTFYRPVHIEMPPMILQAEIIAPEPLPLAPPEPPKDVKPVEPEKPVPPKPVVKKHKEVPLPQIAAAADAPSPVTVAPQPPAPPEPVAIDAPPVHAPDPAPAPVATAPVAAPLPVIPPRHNAEYLQNPRPAYPAMSRRLGEVGRVILRVRVEADGLPSRVEVRRTSGHPRLDDAAVEAVRKWKFVPARRGDEAIAGDVDVPLDFTLGG